MIVFKIASRYFWSKKNERVTSIISWFSLIGISIGVSTLIVVMSIMRGFHDELTKNIIGLNSDIIIRSKTDPYIQDDSLKKKIKNLDFISEVIPIAETQALITSRDNSCGVIIKGIDLKDLQLKKKITMHLDPSTNYDKEIDGIAIGVRLSEVLNAKIGDLVSIVTPSTITTVIGNIPKMKSFIVSNIFQTGMYDYDSNVAIMSMQNVSKFLGYNYPNMIEVYTKNYNKSSEYSAIISNFIGKNYYSISWQEMHGQFLNALKIERIAMFTILTLVILVAAFNIVSTLSIAARDKSKDIAILKTIGLSNANIMYIFLIYGGMIGFIGTLAGIILGTSFMLNINEIRIFLESMSGIKIFEAAVYFLYYLPSSFSISDVIIVSSTSITISLIAAVYPALRASRMHPISIIKSQ